MFFIKCDNAIFKVDGNQKYIKCKKTGETCCFQHYCPQKKSFELLPSADTCKHNPKNIMDEEIELLKVEAEQPIEEVAVTKIEKVEEKSNFNKKHKFEKFVKPILEDKNEIEDATEIKTITIESNVVDCLIEDNVDNIIEDVEKEIKESEE